MTRPFIDPARIALAMSDDALFEAIVKRQDERNQRLLIMGQQARSANLMSKFDERIGE